METIKVKVPSWLKTVTEGYCHLDDGTFAHIDGDCNRLKYAKLIVIGQDVSIKLQFEGCKELTDKVYYKGEDGLMRPFKTDELDIQVSVRNNTCNKVIYSRLHKCDDGAIRTQLNFFNVDKEGILSNVCWRMEDRQYDYDEKYGFVVAEGMFFSKEREACWYEQPVVDGHRETPRAELLKIPEEVLAELKKRMTALTDFAGKNKIKLFYYNGSSNIEAVKQPDGYETFIGCEVDEYIPEELAYVLGRIDSDYCECSDYVPCLHKKES